MAELHAKVIHTDAGHLALEVDRQGACQSCSQKTHCAIQWQPSRQSRPTLEPTLHVEANLELVAGQQMTLSCDDRALVQYLSLMFIPILLALLLGAALIQTTAIVLLAAWVKAIIVGLCTLVGVVCSASLLKRQQQRLLALSSLRHLS